jgi:uncharacterized membrane protein YedE/YeeE
MTLDSLMALTPLFALLLPAVVAWFVTLRFGIWVGAVVPAIVAAAFLIARLQGTGHPEEAMGRGLEVLFIWLPAIVSALVGFGIGLIFRAKRKRKAG